MLSQPVIEKLIVTFVVAGLYWLLVKNHLRLKEKSNRFSDTYLESGTALLQTHV